MANFNLVELPRRGIEIFQILRSYDGNKVEKIGKLDKLFTQGNTFTLPSKKNTEIPNDISENFNFKFDLETKISIFQNLYNKIAGGKFEGKINSSDEFFIAAEDAKMTEISSIISLNNYINDAKLNIGVYEKDLKKGNLFIITSIIKCKKFIIELADKNNLELIGELKAKEIADWESKIQKSQSRGKSITHIGKNELVIGFRAHQLIYDKKFWQSKDKAKYRLNPKENILLRGDVENFETVELKSNSGTISYEWSFM